MKKSIRFAVIADPHLHIHGENGWVMAGESVRILAETISRVNAEHPDFVLLPGDLLYDAEQVNLKAVQQNLAELRAPYFIVAGNHDFRPKTALENMGERQYVSEQEFIQIFSGNGYDGTGSKYYSVIVPGGLRLIGLDGCHRTKTEGWGGELDDEQLFWLEDTLAGAREKVIIMIHHGLVYYGDDHKSQSGRWYSLTNQVAVRKVLSRYREKILLVISGHRHIGLRYVLHDNIPYFTCPSIISYPMRYSMFTITEHYLDYQSCEADMEGWVREEAKYHLLNSEHFQQYDRDELAKALEFYENPAQYGGRIFRNSS